MYLLNRIVIRFIIRFILQDDRAPQKDTGPNPSIKSSHLLQSATQQPMSRSFLPDMRFFSICSSVTFFVSGTKAIVRTMKKALRPA